METHWSNETKINQLDWVQYVWHKPGHNYHSDFTVPTMKHRGRTVLMWSRMSTTVKTGVWVWIQHSPRSWFPLFLLRHTASFHHKWFLQTTKKESLKSFKFQTMDAKKSTNMPVLIKLNLTSWVNCQQFIHLTHHFKSRRLKKTSHKLQRHVKWTHTDL